MNNFRIKLKDFIIILILSMPISIFIYIDNYNNINYVVNIKRGFAVTENFCENYLYSRAPLIADGSLDLINKKYKARYLNFRSKFEGKMQVAVKNDTNVYEISFKGKVGQESDMAMEVSKIYEDISEVELFNFDNLYKKVKLHCRSGEILVFKMVPMQNVLNEFPSTKSYKKPYLFFLATLPFIIFYLLIISFNYLKRLRVE